MSRNNKKNPISEGDAHAEYKSLTTQAIPLSAEEEKIETETAEEELETRNNLKTTTKKPTAAETEPVGLGFKKTKKITDIPLDIVARENAYQTELAEKKPWFWPLKLKINQWRESYGRVPLNQKIFFVQNLGIMLKAGLSLGMALSAIKEQTPNRRLKGILTDVSERVQKGQSFADSLKIYQKIFGELFINMVASGEVSGNMEKVLAQLHHQLKRDHELISKVRGAMIYPAVVVSAMIGVGIAMVVFVMPKFMSMFKEFQATLPLPTRILLKISDFVQSSGALLGVLIVVFLLVFIKLARTTKGKRVLHAFFLKAPVLAPIVKKINLARFARTMSSLIKSDIQIVESFNITSRTLGNVFYREALFAAGEKIKKGSNINSILREYPELFPPVVTQMVTVGEESGAVEDMLSELADFYEEDVDQTMKDLPAIIEPVLMLILGAGVAFMAVSVLMPMYSLSQAI
jgi:type IV pilus assembly protein PilC